MRLLGAGCTLPLFVFLLVLASSHGQKQTTNKMSDAGQTSHGQIISSQTSPEQTKSNQTTLGQIIEAQPGKGQPNQKQPSQGKPNGEVTDYSTQEPSTLVQPNQGQQNQGQQNQGQQIQGPQTQEQTKPGKPDTSSQGGNENGGGAPAAMLVMPSTSEKPGGKRDDNILARAVRAPTAQEADRILTEGASSLMDILPSVLRKLPNPANANILDTLMVFLNYHYEHVKPEIREAVVSWFRMVVNGGATQGSASQDNSAWPAPWLNTSILLCLKRFIVQVKPPDLRGIIPDQMCGFFRNNKSLEILRNMTDLEPLQARILLEKLDSCRGEWEPRAYLQRLGQLTCFFNEANVTWVKNNNMTDLLLDGLQQCASKRDKLYQMVTKTYGEGARLDAGVIAQLGKAVQFVSVTRLLNIGGSVVRDAITELGRLGSWPRGKAKLLVSKYLASGGNISSATDLQRMGSLVAGLDSQTLRRIPAKELLSVAEEFSVQAELMRPSQHKAIVSKIIEEVNISRALDYLKGSLVSAISLARLKSLTDVTNKTFENKQWNKGQAFFLVKKFLKDGQVISSADVQNMASASSGLTCAMLRQLDNSTLLHCSEILAGRRDLMSRAQLKCLAQRVFSWLNTTRDNFFFNVSSEELRQIAPNLLLQLRSSELKKIPKAVCGNLTQQLGRADHCILAKGAPHRQNIITIVKTCWNSTSGPTVEEVELMGLLVCLLPAPDIRALSTDAFSAAVEQFKLCLQLDSAQKEAVAANLQQAFGASSNWTEDTVFKLGILLATLKAENISSIRSTYLVLPANSTKHFEAELKDNDVQKLAIVLRRIAKKKITAEKYPALVAEALQSILANAPTINDTQSEFNSTLDLAELSKKYYSSMTANAAPRSRRSTDCLNNTDTIMNLQDANSQWTPEKLACMSNQTFIDSVDVLGSVKGFTNAQLEALKIKSFTAWGPQSNWTSEQFASLGNIVQSFTWAELSTLNIDIAETAAAFASLPQWMPDKRMVEAFLMKYPAVNIKEEELTGKGNLICGFSDAQILEIPKAVFSTVVASLGAATCSNSTVLKVLKNKAIEALGPVSSWNDSTLQEVGNIAGGLTPAELSGLNSSLVSSIKPSAVPFLSLEAFKALSLTQLSAFGADNAAASTKEQRSALSPEQSNVLLQVINNIEPKAVVAPGNSAGGSGVDVRVAVSSLVALTMLAFSAA